MAKERMINTKFWDDGYIARLTPVQKLLFIYLITNPLTNIAGVYEIEIRRISFDTGIDEKEIVKYLEQFEHDDKVYYFEGWVAVKNFIKHQKDNPKVAAGIYRCLEDAPSEIIDRLSIDYQGLSHLTKLNLTKPNLTESEQGSHDEVVQIIDLFKKLEISPAASRWYGNKTQRGSIERLLKDFGFDAVKSVVELLPKTNKTKYMPSVTTPYQLEEKWFKLRDALIVKKTSELSAKPKMI